MEEETVENRFGFAGEMLDAVTGQYYLRARFYNPVIARFLSEDMYYGDGLNLYAYCHNNPVGYVDPSGHICEKKQYKLEQYKEYLKQGIDKKEAYQKANYDAIKKYNGLEAAERYRKSHQNTNPVYEQNQKKSNGAGSDSKSGTSSVAKPNQGQGFSSKGYNPQPGERTFEGFVKQISDPEISLYTKSSGFNNNPKGTGGQFKRFGANEHYGLAPHVHQPVRNVTPNGMIFGKTGKDVGIDVFSPNKKDIKQLYEYLNNGKYHE